MTLYELLDIATQEKPTNALMQQLVMYAFEAGKTRGSLPRMNWISVSDDTVKIPINTDLLVAWHNGDELQHGIACLCPGWTDAKSLCWQGNIGSHNSVKFWARLPTLPNAKLSRVAIAKSA
jgi:hypothetical protein